MTSPGRPVDPGQRVILRLCWGQQDLLNAVLEPGCVLRVGRAETADLAVPQDEHMSDVHFQVSWAGQRCQLRDLRSGTGTHVRGERVEEAELTHGCWVRAGSTDFMVYFEGATPRRAPAAQETTEALAAKLETLKVLGAQAHPLYGVLDAARDDRILEVLRESVEEYRSLYEGPQGDVLADVAPYLVHLPKGSRLLEVLVQEGWGESWGVYMTSRQSFTDLRRHLRKFLMVKSEGGEGRLYFRFYDPRVMRIFLTTCTLEQKAELLRGIDSLWVESEEMKCCEHMAPAAAELAHSSGASPDGVAEASSACASSPES